MRTLLTSDEFHRIITQIEEAKIYNKNNFELGIKTLVSVTVEEMKVLINAYLEYKDGLRDNDRP